MFTDYWLMFTGDCLLMNGDCLLNCTPEGSRQAPLTSHH